ncbi:hypothetical protein DIPPA_12146 [Diplonema papillatum]|nr:hypothetical protein DIPPA_63418 [Diplonema papillatum]KAJ9444594.1 hypothetical protein DIPPA_12148 [Diplonema papillatum]KAJ9444595.1 hypothetical protein DIPPA_12146 [Diplonema papillatum]
MPLTTEQSKAVVDLLELQGFVREAAMVAAVWLTRARVPDLRVVTTEDIEEISNRGGEPRSVGVQLFLKEKQAKTYNAPEYLPPGELTAKLVRLARGAPPGPLFARTKTEYDLSLQRIRAALPEGAVMHSFRRGATQELERAGASRSELVDLLRHADPRTTRRYMMRTAPADVERKSSQLAPLQ